MDELNKTSALEPPPVWGCNHNWIFIGPRVSLWTTTNTSATANNASGAIRKRKCVNCGGYEWADVMPAVSDWRP